MTKTKDLLKEIIRSKLEKKGPRVGLKNSLPELVLEIAVWIRLVMIVVNWQGYLW